MPVAVAATTIEPPPQPPVKVEATVRPPPPHQPKVARVTVAAALKKEKRG
jgi:hypothetical protein